MVAECMKTIECMAITECMKVKTKFKVIHKLVIAFPLQNELLNRPKDESYKKKCADTFINFTSKT